ncbi:MAG: D-alanine--D-alanine ligase [Planctomycetaceae bacterium]|nr:D-alanine--D-alanine ligase [Planctomycetaceae bacterium]
MNILLLLGGTSAEREISLRSGKNVLRALEAQGHHVVCLDPAEQPLSTTSLPDCDVVFLALHGTYGEDGQVQSLLEQQHLPYTGSGPEASRLAFHKLLAKKRFRDCDVATPACVAFTSADTPEKILLHAEKLGFPVYVKPNAQGSSLGVSPARDRSQLLEAVPRALKYDQTGLVEQAVTGAEWTVALFDEVTFPLIFVEPAQQFYDYHAKYGDPATRFHIDPPLAPEIRHELIHTARAAYRAVGACSLARVDLILDHAGKAWVLEVNTLPGLTDQSTVPMAAAQFGWSMPELCDRMCQAALHRHLP